MQLLLINFNLNLKFKRFYVILISWSLKRWNLRCVNDLRGIIWTVCKEIKRFSSAMEKPEFVDLLGDYMKEISDPKNRV